MRTAKWLPLTLAAAIAAGGLFTFEAAAADGAGPQGPRAKLRERVKEELQLTDEQIAQIKEQLKSEREVLRALLTRLREARAALRQEIQKPGATEDSVRKAAAGVAAVESDLAVERLKLHGKINPILTAEQREKLAEFQAGIDELVGRLIERGGKRPAK